MVVLFVTATLVAATPPTVTIRLAPLTKFAPDIVMDVLPAVNPDVGETDAMLGAGAM